MTTARATAAAGPESRERLALPPGLVRQLDDLRSRQRERPASREAQRVVTVRMPRSLHESLKAEAESMPVSINSLCISKLLKLLDEEERRELAERPAEEGPEAFAAYAERRRRSDLDLWLVELDIADAERFAAETIC